MNRSRVAVLFGLAAVLWQACGVDSGDTDSETTAYTWQTDPSLAPLRAEFGVPNQNIKLNPRAFKVSNTPSVADVEQVLPNQLVIGAQHAAWLLQRTPGDVLYCGTACSGGAFLRRIVDLHQSGNSVIVDTKPAGLTDIVISGWLYGKFLVENPMGLDQIPAAGLPAIPIDVPGVTDVGEAEPRGTSPQTTNAQNTWKPGGVSLGTCPKGDDGQTQGTTVGSASCLTFTPTFSFSMPITFSMAVSEVPATQVIPGNGLGAKTERLALEALFGTVSSGLLPELTQFLLEDSPTISIGSDIKLQSSVTYTWPTKTIYQTPKITIVPLVIGPIDVNTTLSVEVGVSGSVGGVLTLDGNVTNSYTATLGMQYTTAAGWTNPSNFSQKQTGTASVTGTATAKAGLAVQPMVSESVYSVAGPVMGFNGGLGLELKATASATATGSVTESTTGGTGASGSLCAKASFGLYYYITLGVSGGFDIDLFPIYTLWEKSFTKVLKQGTWEFPIKVWSTQTSGCTSGGTSSGGTSSGSSSSSGSGTGGSGTGGSGTGGTTAGSNGTGSGGTTGSSVSTCSGVGDSGCGSDVCVVPAQVCGGEEGTPYCSDCSPDTIGMACNSDSDCNATGNTCTSAPNMQCSDCTSLGCPGTQCCNYGSTAG